MRYIAPMASTHPYRDSSVVGVTNADRQIARDLISLLSDRHAQDRFELRGKDGKAAALSAPMLNLIERAARIVAEGANIDLLPQDKDLTSQEAAAYLGVSRQYLVRILDRGDIPFTRTGSHRRIRSADIIDYRERRDTNRRQALARIAQEAQAASGYNGIMTLGPIRAR